MPESKMWRITIGLHATLDAPAWVTAPWHPCAPGRYAIE